MQALCPSFNAGPTSVPDKEEPDVVPSAPPPQEDDGDIESFPFQPETEPCRGPGGPGPETCRARENTLAALRPPPRD
jgi:hypothetical protein